MMRPLLIQRTILVRDLPIMLVTGLFLGHALRDGNISRVEALLLLAVFFSLVSGSIYAARQKKASSVGDQGIPAASDIDNSLGKAFLLGDEGFALTEQLFHSPNEAAVRSTTATWA